MCVALLGGQLFAGSASGAGEAVVLSDSVAEVAAVGRAFAATQPSLISSYRVGYRFAAIEWCHLADATLVTTEGTWTLPGAAAPVPACFVDLRLDSTAKETAQQRSRISLHNRIIAVLTMPELKTILYVKRFDQHLNPIMGRTRIVDTFERYDMQTGVLDYRRDDYQTKSIATNMAGAAMLEQQSREILAALDMIARVHKRNGVSAGPETNMTIQVSVDGQVVPVVLALSPDKAPISFHGMNLPVTRIQAKPDRRAKVRSNDCSIWAMSFREAATSLNDPVMITLASRTPVETMLPLTVDYELVLGQLRCTLAGLETTNWTQVGLADSRWVGIP